MKRDRSSLKWPTKYANRKGIVSGGLFIFFTAVQLLLLLIARHRHASRWLWVGFSAAPKAHEDEDEFHTRPSGCVTSQASTKAKTICSLRHACWDFSNANIISVREDMHNQVSGRRIEIHRDLKIDKINSRDQHLWKEDYHQSKDSLWLDGTTALHFMYQHAFQHYVPDFLHMLPAYWSPEEFNASSPKRALFLTRHECHGCSDVYGKDLFNAALCGQTSRTCTVPTVYPFETFDKALDWQVNKALWCHEESSCSKSDNISSVCFERLVLSLTGGFDWHFNATYRDELVYRVLGKERHIKRHICVNQRLGTRQILNLAEVVDFLRRKFHFFPTLVFFYEGMSFTEQVRTADSCYILLGPHGGGMTNAAFVRSDSSVIELHPGWYQHIYFYAEAVKSAGARYVPIVVPPSNITLGDNCLAYANVTKEVCERDDVCQYCFKDSSMYVDINLLEHGLSSLGTFRV